jgi:hypothetical protein
MLAWVRTDVEHRTVREGTEDQAKFATLLNQLDSHLLLWFAKYEAWLPNQPNHALVYLDDEEQHGLKFPHGIEEMLGVVLAAAR